MDAPPASSSPLLVACLCARWCGTCRDYQATFDGALATLGEATARGVWIDIEDDAALVDNVDVEDFPTLLIARDGALLFFGPITPQPPTLARLLSRASAGELPPPPRQPDVQALVQRLAAAVTTAR